jgi:hypothetical protein
MSAPTLDVQAYLDRKCRGEPWHLLAREAGVPMGQFRTALEAVGADRLAAAGYRITGSPRGQRPARYSKPHRRRRGAVTTNLVPEKGIVDDGVQGALSTAPPPAIPRFDRPAGDTARLTDKYRPRTLAEVLGQPEVVGSLRRFAANPYPCAMLFTGDSGIGKTSAAYALAHDLGCAVDATDLGGVFEIPSGSQSADSVRKVLDTLRYRPLCGSGWRVLMVNECDRMALPVETIWLDALEHLPRQTVVVFTTNEPERLNQRFRDRCEAMAFSGGSNHLKPWIDALVRQLWEREGAGPMPNLDGLGMPTLGDAGTMTASFRLALQQLQQLLRTN